MYKKILVLGLVASMSAQAMYRGQELQVVVKTPVAQAIRWLSSGSPEANVAAGAIAASVVYSGVSLVTLPYRTWVNKRDRQMWAEQLSGIADQIKNNHEKMVASEDQSTRGSTPSIVITDDKFDEFERKLATITAALEASKKQETVLVDRLVIVEQKTQQPLAQSVSQNSAGTDELTELKKQMADFENTLRNVGKKADNAYMLHQKVGDLDTAVTSHTKQLLLLENHVYKPADKVVQPVDKK